MIDRLKKAEDLFKTEQFEKAVPILLEVTEQFDPKSPEFELAFNNLFRLYKVHFKTDSALLNKEMLQDVYLKYQMQNFGKSPLPVEAILSDERNPRGVMDFIKNKLHFAGASYQMASLWSEKTLGYLDEAERLYKLSKDTIIQFKPRMDESLDAFLCSAINNTGNIEVNRARFHSRGNWDATSIAAYSIGLINATPERFTMAVCLHHVLRAKEHYLDCFNNSNFSDGVDVDINEIRNDARQSLVYINDLIEDPYQFIDTHF